MYVPVGNAAQAAISRAQVAMQPYRGAPHTVAQMHRFVAKDRLNPQTRAMAEDVVRHVYGKDYLSEAAALYYAVCRGIRYTRDPSTVELVKDAGVIARTRQADCLPEGTLLFTPSGFVPIELVKPGDVIMGDGAWTRVTSWWDKGILDLIAIGLTTGGTLRCTPDHKLFVVPTHRAPGARDDAVEVSAEEVEPGDHVLTPATLPFGRESLGTDRAWLLGAFAADGWTKTTSGGTVYASIAGKDGFPKEAQKRRVKQIVEAMGCTTRWHERYITIKGGDVPSFLAACGRGAPNKHIPSLDLDEESVRGVLQGLEADSTVIDVALRRGGSRTYSSTSRTLALQIRVMQRMLGYGTSIRRVDDHGGLGSNPIYRIGVWRPVRSDGRRWRPYAVVHSVAESVAAPCYDIATESGRIYLPEHDIVVHNCDEQSHLLASLVSQVGTVGTRYTTVGFHPQGQDSHVFTRFPDPRGSGHFVVLDPVAGPTTATMLRRVKTWHDYQGF